MGWNPMACISTSNKKNLAVLHDKVFCFDLWSVYFFFLFCSSAEMDSRMEVSAMMFLYFM